MCSTPLGRVGHLLICPRCPGYKCLQDNVLRSEVTDSVTESPGDLWALFLGKAGGRRVGQ